MRALLDDDARGSGMKNSSSLPIIPHVMSGLLGEPLMPLIRRVSTTDMLFMQHKESPLHDLAPVALPGLTSRVSRNNLTSLSLNELDAAFERVPDPESVMHVAGGFSRELVSAAGLAVICAWNYGFMLGSMNTASAAMRRTLGIASDTPENDIA